MRKVELSGLPIKEGIGSNQGKMLIDWKNSTGCKIPFIYDEIDGELEIVGYDSKSQVATIKYKDNITTILTNSIIKSNLGRIVGKKTMDFKINIGTTIKDDKRDLTIIDREYRDNPNNKGKFLKWYKYTCNVCGWTEGWIVEYNLVNGNNCSCCSGKTAALGINTIWDTDRWMCDLGVSEEDAKNYTKCSGKKITVVCPDCGRIKIMKLSNIYTHKSIGCPCGDGASYPEKFMTDVLTQIGVEFEVQYSPNYLSNKKSDFYLPCLNLVIETDGKLGHNGGYVHGYSKKSLEDEILIDRWKDEQHRIHGVDTIRINCFESDMEYIKNNILKSKLNELFDLTNIDFVQADLFAIKSNKVKEVCDYWNQKEEWETTSDLAKKLNMWAATIINYLKKGVKLGWCDYDPKEEMRKSTSRTGKRLLGYCNPPKKVEILREGESLGVFNSVSELCKYWSIDFGIDFSHGNISMVCSGKRNHHKGYTFKYIEN